MSVGYTLRLAALALALAAATLCGACKRAAEPASTVPASAADVQFAVQKGWTRNSFGALANGTPVERYTLTNGSGMKVQVLTFGGIVSAIEVPDRNGAPTDVVLGYDTLDEYVRDTSHFGGIIGRYANRIAGAKFELDGKPYRLAANSGSNTLHGGTIGFDKAVWQASAFTRPHETGVVLTHTSPDMDEGFPGALALTVTYTLTDANELAIDYLARTDKPTVVNLTNHSYFNLAGMGNVLNQRLALEAATYTPVDAALIPTGELAAVAGTPFDFRASTAIGARIAAENTQLRLGNGYDHNFVVTRDGAGLELAARVEDPASGRVLEVRTTEPGVQFYTANHFDGSIRGKSGRAYGRNDAFCLETQHFPDSPNHAAFPSTTLMPGQDFRSRTVYAFSVRP